MFKVQTIPLFALRPIYSSLRAFQKSFNDVIQSRRAIHAMNNLFHFATEEELSQMDAVCIICRDEMVIEDRPKKLPCGHIFHTTCLRTWFQFQRTCPTCRANVLTMSLPTTNSQGNNQNVNNRNENQNATEFENRPTINLNIPQNDRIRVAFRFDHIPQNNQFQNTNGTQGGNNTNQQQPNSASNMHFQMPYGIPIFPMFTQPPPYPQMNPVSFPDPPDYSGLSEEELRQMESDTRDGIIARIDALKNIHILLEAAVLQFDQYRNVQIVKDQMKEREERSGEETHRNQEQQTDQVVESQDDQQQ